MKFHRMFAVISFCMLATAVAPAQIPATLGWHQIPNTKLGPVCPVDPAVQSVLGCNGVIVAWNSGIADTTRSRLVLWGGGHNDYFGNELYALDLNALTMSRLNNPSPVDNVGSCPETYPDGRPSARHTYDSLTYIPTVDRMFSFGGSKSICGGASQSTWTFNFATLQWQNMNPGGTLPRAEYGVVADYDASTNSIFVHDTVNFSRYDIASNSYTRLASNVATDYQTSGLVDPDRKLFIMMGTGQVRVFDISAGSNYAMQSWDGQVSGCGGLVSTTYPGLAYDTAQKRVIGWAGGNTLYTFNPDTKSCTTASYTGGPGPAPGQGVNGHFQYFPSQNIFLLVNGLDGQPFQNAYALRLTQDTVTPPPPPPPPQTSQVTSFQLTSSLGGTLPFTVGLGFKKGDLTGFPVLTVPTSQVIVKSRWTDNSVKHAIASGQVALTAGVPSNVGVSSSASVPSGTNLTAADIQAANPAASVQLGSIGTVSLSSLLATPFRTWISGPEMVEAHYRRAVGSDPTLAVWFYVRMYKGGRVWVRTNVENGYVNTTTANKTYTPSVRIGTTTVFTNNGNTLIHYANTRWTADGWIGTDPQVVPRIDTTYLMNSKLVPNYWKRNPSSSILNSLNQSYTPMTNGMLTPSMGNGGYQEQIGLLPLWDALYISSGADARAYKSVLANASSMNSYPIAWRNPSTQLPAKPSDFPSYAINGGTYDLRAGPYTWEMNHAPSEGYVAYLVTGDYWYYETMLLHLSLDFLALNDGTGSGVNRLLTAETRGTAWNFRNMVQTLALAPTGDAVAADYRILLANNVSHWKAVKDTLGGQGIGYLHEYNVDLYAPGTIAPWQQHFFIQSVGMGSDLEPLTNMVVYNEVRDWMYRGSVGILGDANGFCFTYASSYNIKISSGGNDNPSSWYPNWKAVSNATLGNNVSCGNTLLGDSASGGHPTTAHEGYWGNLMPSIAYAVDHGAVGAAASWARLTGASNWSTIERAGFDDTPLWGIVPRTLPQPPPPPPTTIDLTAPSIASTDYNTAHTAMLILAQPSSEEDFR